MSTNEPKPLTLAKPDYFHMFVDYAGLLTMLMTSLVGWLVFHLKGAPLVLVATWGLVAGSAVAVLASLVVRRKVATMPAIYGAAALVFGGLTLFYKDPQIVEMKTTFIDSGLGLLMLGGFAMGKSPIKLLMGQAIQLTDRGWKTLTLRFGFFFLAMALANEVVRHQSHELWLSFRVVGSIVLTLIFSGFQAPLMMREAHVHDAEQTKSSSKPD